MALWEMRVEKVKQDTSPAQRLPGARGLAPRSEKAAEFEKAAFAELVATGAKDAVTATSAEREATSLAAILAHFERAGFARHEPKLLQPAGVFLDRSGEDFRGHLYLTTDASGAELCLRPEYTIPVCRDYLASAEVGRAATFAYGGSVFRAPAHGEAGDGEFLQAGRGELRAGRP